LRSGSRLSRTIRTVAEHKRRNRRKVGKGSGKELEEGNAGRVTRKNPKKSGLDSGKGR